MFDDLLTDRITLTKLDGRAIPDIKASVQGKKVYVLNPDIPFEEGDELSRALPNGHVERYTVKDCVFHAGIAGDRGHFEIIVEKLRAGQIISKPTRELGPNRSADFWALMHPSIVDIARPRFLAGHFADAVEAALKHVNKAVKDRAGAVLGKDLDGAKLMTRVFSLDHPLFLLGDLKTESGRSAQQGYMQLFAGSMTGVRNPKAHANLEIEEGRAWHFLFLASLLMLKLDEALEPGKRPPSV